MQVSSAKLAGRKPVSPVWVVLLLLAMLGFALIVGLAIPILGIFAAMVVVVLFLAALVAIDFRVGVVIAVILMPLSVLSMFPHQLFGVRGLNPLNALLAATFLSYFAHAGFGRWKDPILPKRLLLWYLLPITIAALVGFRNAGKIPEYFRTIRAIQFDSGVGYLLDLYLKPLFLVILSVLVALAARHSKRPEKLIFAMIVPGWVFLGLVAFLILNGSLSLGDLASAKARGFISILGFHANELSLMMNMLYALTIYSLIGQEGKLARVVLFVSAVAFAVLVLLTFSRGGFLGFAVVNLIFFWRRVNFLTVILGLLVASVIGLFLFDALVERMLTGVATGDRGAISAGRLDSIWAPLLPYVLANPIAPNGLSSILWSEPIRLNRMMMVAQTHNAWLGGIMDFGLIGFGFMLAFLLYVKKEFIRLAEISESSALKGIFLGGSVTIVVWFVQAITDDRFSPTFAQVYFWIAFGLLMGSGGSFNKKTSVSIGQGKL